MSQVLIIYYSLTNQTENVLKAISQELTAAGHRVDFAKIHPQGNKYRIPYPKGQFFWEWALAWVGVPLRVKVDPLVLKQSIENYDLVLLGHQPWYLDTSIPMASWLETPEAQGLKGKQIVSIMTARTLWERAFKRLAERVETLGGNIVDSFVVRNLTPMPQNMLLTLHFLFEGHDQSPAPLKKMGNFGIGQSGLQAAAHFGQGLALRLQSGPLKDSLSHTEANRQGLLRGNARSELKSK